MRTPQELFAGKHGEFVATVKSPDVELQKRGYSEMLTQAPQERSGSRYVHAVPDAAGVHGRCLGSVDADEADVFDADRDPNPRRTSP
jgi:hypothetical protein